MNVDDFISLASEAANLAGIRAKFVPFRFGDGIQITSFTRHYQSDMDRFLVEITTLADAKNYTIQFSTPNNDTHLKNAFLRFGFVSMTDTHQLQMERVPQTHITQHEYDLHDELTKESWNFKSYLSLIEKQKKL